MPESIVRYMIQRRSLSGVARDSRVQYSSRSYQCEPLSQCASARRKAKDRQMSCVSGGRFYQGIWHLHCSFTKREIQLQGQILKRFPPQAAGPSSWGNRKIWATDHATELEKNVPNSRLWRTPVQCVAKCAMCLAANVLYSLSSDSSKSVRIFHVTEEAGNMLTFNWATTTSLRQCCCRLPLGWQRRCY